MTLEQDYDYAVHHSTKYATRKLQASVLAVVCAVYQAVKGPEFSNLEQCMHAERMRSVQGNAIFGDRSHRFGVCHENRNVCSWLSRTQHRVATKHGRGGWIRGGVGLGCRVDVAGISNQTGHLHPIKPSSTVSMQVESVLEQQGCSQPDCYRFGAGVGDETLSLASLCCLERRVQGPSWCGTPKTQQHSSPKNPKP